jgi:signal transduction histidine kinase
MDRFLHAERFRKGKVQVHPGHVVLKNLLTECASHFSYQAKDKNVELRVDAQDEMAIESDKELLLLIFQNLLSNALKYTDAGTTVTIHGECGPDSCKISVIDQGPGIAPEKLAGLFDPFARGETHGQPGVGLGLSIARQAAQYLTAKLWAESQLGKGSTFVVELPKQIRKS